MPRVVSEVGAGAQFSRSSDENQISDSQTRTFRIVLTSPTEFVDIQAACGVYIGYPHPVNAWLFCVSFDASFEGDSRSVILATFNYRSSPSAQPEDPKKQPPPIRPANWSTSTSLSEVPKAMWRRRKSASSWAAEVPAINPVGDVYDGVTGLEPIVSIRISQWEESDPTKFNLYAGSVNLDAMTLGTLDMKPGTLMFRGVSAEPALESWGEQQYRGWRCTYEFSYRRNETTVRIGEGVEPSENDAESEIEIGWDIAVPMSGYNVRAFNPAAAAANEDIYAQPLKYVGKVLANPVALAEGVDAGDKVRAMVRVPEFDDGKSLQTTSASPVALKPNGRPLKTHNAAGDLTNRPYVYAYRTQPAINMRQTLGLRLN